MATNFAETALDIFIARVPQVNYTAPLVPTGAISGDKPYVAERVKQRAFPSLKATKKNNADYSGGNGFATESWVEAWTSAYSYGLDLASQNIGRYLLLAFGSVETTILVAGKVYKHVFKPLDRRATSVMPATAIAVKNAEAAGGVDALYPSLTCDEFKLASSDKARLDGNVSFTGSGEELSPSGIDRAQHVEYQDGKLNYFYHQQSVLSIADAAAKANVENLSTCHLLRWNFGVSNQYAQNDYGCPRFIDADNPESGALRSNYPLVGQSFMLDYLLKMRSSDAAHEALKDQKPLSIAASMYGSLIADTSYRHGLTLQAALAKYNAVERGFTDGFATVQVTPDVLFDTSANEIVTAELINNVASYKI